MLWFLAIATSSEAQGEFINTKRIAEYINDLNTTWQAGVNERFRSVTLAEARMLCGSLPDGEMLPQRSFSSEELYRAKTSSEFDVRIEWGEMCPTTKEVRDQSNCGSCWAFGAVEAASDRICIQSRGKDRFRLSAEDLLACCSNCGNGCNGGSTAAAWNWLVSTGVVTGGEYHNFKLCKSYTMAPCDHHGAGGKYGPCPSGSAPTPRCVRECDANSTYAIVYKNDRRKFLHAYSLQGMETIQTEIMNFGSVEASFTLYEDFLTYKSGVYQRKTGKALGSHAVKLLGWGVQPSPAHAHAHAHGPEEGTPYWIAANSWNEEWGSGGFFKILRGTNEAGIENAVQAATYA